VIEISDLNRTDLNRPTLRYTNEISSELEMYQL